MKSFGLDLSVVLLAGLVAGGIDIIAAALINQVSPAIISRAIASGVLGSQALRGGGAVVILGVLLQFIMACLIAAIFYSASNVIDLIRQHPLIAGALFGLPVYLVMTYVVVPLSRAKPNQPASFAAAMPDILAMIVFGLVVAAMPQAMTAVRTPISPTLH